MDRHELSAPMDFTDLEPIVVPVTILRKNPEDGKYRPVSHVLKEASEDAAVKWKNAAMRHIQYGDDGKIKTLGSVAECEPLLVAMCLFEILPDGGHKAVPDVEIRKMSSRVVQQLFERAKQISGLDDEDTEEVLLKRIDRDQKALAKIQSGRPTAAEESEKNS